MISQPRRQAVGMTPLRRRRTGRPAACGEFGGPQGLTVGIFNAAASALGGLIRADYTMVSRWTRSWYHGHQPPSGDAGRSRTTPRQRRTCGSLTRAAERWKASATTSATGPGRLTPPQSWPAPSSSMNDRLWGMTGSYLGPEPVRCHTHPRRLTWSPVLSARVPAPPVSADGPVVRLVGTPHAKRRF